MEIADIAEQDIWWRRRFFDRQLSRRSGTLEQTEVWLYRRQPVIGLWRR
jgi:hypothetical protein